MLAASIPVLGHSTAAMGISQQDDSFDLPSGANGVYVALSVNTSTPLNRYGTTDDIIHETSPLSSPSLSSSPESSLVSFSQGNVEHQSPADDNIKPIEDQEPEEHAEHPKPVESQEPCVKPKYGSVLVGLPEKFMKKVEGLEKKKEKLKKKKWRPVSAEDMGFKLTLFPREPVTDVEHTTEKALMIFDEMIQNELDDTYDQVKPFRHLLKLECSGLSKDDRFLRKDNDRRVQKAHKQVKSKNITSVLNNRGRKTLYIHFRLYKRHPFLHCSNLEHPNLPSPHKREGVCLDVAKSAIKAQAGGAVYNSWAAGGRSAPRVHPPQNLNHALDTGNSASDLPADMLSFLISLQHREMTPEDYEMLLRLDEGVTPKTVAEDVICEFKTDVVDESTAGDVCSVCMEMYEVGQCRKFLPCGHVFHEQCIDMWLSNSSQNCPLDGLPVGLS